MDAGRNLDKLVELANWPVNSLTQLISWLLWPMTNVPWHPLVPQVMSEAWEIINGNSVNIGFNRC